MSEELGSGARILVVDDDEVDRERVRRFLARGGIDATVVEQADPAAALEIVRHGAADVVVLDYHFPRHDGLGVLREIRAVDSPVQVVVLTGQDETSLAVELMKAGAADYLPKSGLTPERLAQSIRRAVRLRSSEIAARDAQNALRASEELNRSVLESTLDCVKVLTHEGLLVSMSPRGREKLGIADFAMVAGRPWLGFWSSEQQPAAHAALEEARAGRTGRFVGWAGSAGGEILWWDVVITAIATSAGCPERLLAVSRDVTQQRRQADFEQQLIGIVSHDLRGPINAMMLAASLLEKQVHEGSPAAVNAQRIVRSGKRATRLVHDLLDFTQVRLAGALPMAKQVVDLHGICQQAVDEIGPSHPERAIVHRAEGDGWGTWDPERIAQVVGNLTRNAVSYSPPGSPVTVRSTARGSEVRIEIHNEGPPIPGELVPTLFQPFKRGDRKHDEGRSIGLGLFIVREIVHAHGGSVSVRSSDEDGTTFSVALPRGAPGG